MNYKNTYLGPKGYTLLKKDLTSQEETSIKNDLTIKPFSHNGGPGNNDIVSFPSYRESAQKLYIPRYYGEKMFGKPKEMKLSIGETIHVPFQASLRENQIPVVDAFLQHVSEGTNGGLLDLPCAYGKTVIALYILSQLKKKTIILVHKEFLTNQWIERIQQFLPSARIGRIQGQIIDIEEKDIVLGMIQSLSMKEYPSSLFESFGFTIIDEVHHISSQVFSNTLFKLVTPYMLGLSATMNRKDGTTHVFKMFLGDVVYKGKRDEQHEVEVRSIEYEVNDDEFNHVSTDYRGQPMYSTMISKLCEYNRRSEFILKIVEDTYKENTETQQIMILAHNKSLLKYLHDAIAHRQIANGSVGYYVGGMKESALKISEGKKIIIATYSMAAEALDIKTLTTLVMATPKTDIEQSVGRILREKHSQPRVIDIVDSHDLFQRQWQKRKDFYKKQNYKIIHTNNEKYHPRTHEWEVLYFPGTKEERKRKSKKGSDEEILQGKCFIRMRV
jgi:superfamily II DNA or RNA helicase